MKREAGLLTAKRLKDLLIRRGYPVRRIMLYGSAAKGTATSASDIAVVTEAFRESRVREGGDILPAVPAAPAGHVGSPPATR